MKMLNSFHAYSWRMAAFKKNKHFIVASSDYAEAFDVDTNHQAQFEHFGQKPQIHLESSTFMYHDKDTNEIKEKYFANFSDDADQHASTSFENAKRNFNVLKEEEMLVSGKTTIYDHSDGCRAQCKSATSIYLLTLLSILYNVTIDKMIHAPSHGKGKVDGLAAVMKKFLLKCMRNACDHLKNLKKTCKHRFEPFAHKEGKTGNNSFSDQAVRLCRQKFGPKEESDIKVGDKRKNKMKTKRYQITIFLL